MNKKLVFWAIILFIIFAFLYSISDILFPFIFGILVAYLFDPIVYKLVKEGMNRTFASALIILTFSTALVGVVVLAAPVLLEQAGALADALPGYYESFKNEVLPNLERKIYNLSPEIAEQAKLQVKEQSELIDIKGKISKVVAGVIGSGSWLFNLLSLIFITPIVSFYILRDWGQFKDEAEELLPRQYEQTIKTQIRKIDDTVSAFLRGQLNVCLILGTYYAVALTIAGLNFGLVIGFAAGLLCFVPFLGVLTGTLIGLLVAFFQFDGDLVQIGIIAGIFMVGQVLEGNFLTPKIVGEKIGVHPAWLIFGMLAGGSLLGLTGVIISVPLTAIINVLIQFAIEEYEKSEFYGVKKKPARKKVK